MKTLRTLLTPATSVASACVLSLAITACGSSDPAPAPAAAAPTAPAAPPAPVVSPPGTLVPGAEPSVVAVPAVPAFNFTLDHAAEIQIDATGTPDVQLLLLSGDSVINSDSDSGAGTDAQITTFLAPGTYEARVSEWRGRALDARIAVTEPEALTPVGALTTGRPSNVTAPAGETRRAASVELTLQITTEGSYRIDATTAEGSGRDPELMIHRDGAVVGEDSDSGDGNNAQLVRTLTPGTYRVRVRDWVNREAAITVTLTRA